MTDVWCDFPWVALSNREQLVYLLVARQDDIHNRLALRVRLVVG